MKNHKDMDQRMERINTAADYVRDRIGKQEPVV